MIRDYSTTPARITSRCSPRGQTLGFNNSNALVKNGAWDIQLQKTGYIREAGRCVVMLATIASKPMVIVLLDSIGKFTRVADAQRVKHWLETGESLPATMFRQVAQKSPSKALPRPHAGQGIGEGDYRQARDGDVRGQSGAAGVVARWGVARARPPAAALASLNSAAVGRARATLR